MRKLDCYLRTYRRQWGFSQRELSFLLGVRDRSVWARYERGQRAPSARFSLGCEVLFNASARDLFPKIQMETEDVLMRRAYVLYERLKQEKTPSAEAKLRLLDDLLKRVTGSCPNPQ